MNGGGKGAKTDYYRGLVRLSRRSALVIGARNEVGAY